MFLQGGVTCMLDYKYMKFDGMPEDIYVEIFTAVNDNDNIINTQQYQY